MCSPAATVHMYNTTIRIFATFYFHCFLIQPEFLPEELIGDAAEAVLKKFMGDVTGVEPEVVAEYLHRFSDPATTTGPPRASISSMMKRFNEKENCLPADCAVGCNGPH